MRKIFRLRYLFPLLSLLAVLYGWQVEPRLLTVQRVLIRDSVLAKAWPGLTIVQISDLHLTREGPYQERLLAKINRLKPDLILMTGDYKQWLKPPGPAQRFLSRLSAPLGVYGVLGDADQSQDQAYCAYCHPGDDYHSRLTHPVILQNEIRTLPWRGGTITVAGADFGAEGDQWLAGLEAAPDSGPMLVLSHQSKPWNDLPPGRHLLWLSGDTHGGQIRLPAWFWRLFPYKPDPAHMGGLYGNGRGGWLLVNRGIGETAWMPIRIGVPPEIDVITFGPPRG